MNDDWIKQRLAENEELKNEFPNYDPEEVIAWASEHDSDGSMSLRDAYTTMRDLGDDTPQISGESSGDQASSSESPKSLDELRDKMGAYLKRDPEPFVSLSERLAKQMNYNPKGDK